MPQVLASGKVGSQRYADNDTTKPCPDLDDIEIIQNYQNAFEETQGYCLSNEKGNSDSQDGDLSIITSTNIADYNKSLSSLIQTYVANGSYLQASNPASVNTIVLSPRKIADIASPNGTNYSKNTSLPFAFRDNLSFTFRATATNTGAVQVSIPDLAGLSGNLDLLDETNSALVGGEIISGRFYKIVCATISTVKKLILIRSTAPVATQAEVNAGTNNTNFVTPLRLRNGFSMSLTTNGYIAFPSWLGGIIFQWGRNTIAGGVVNTAVALPIAYPTANLLAIGNAISNNVDEQASKVYPTNLSTITLVNGEGVTREIIWFSIGY